MLIIRLQFYPLSGFDCSLLDDFLRQFVSFSRNSLMVKLAVAVEYCPGNN